MTGKMAEKFMWRVIVIHLAFLAIFFFAVRYAKAETAEMAPAATGASMSAVVVPGGT